MQQLLPREYVAEAEVKCAIIVEFENKKTNIMLKKFGNDQYLNLKNLTHVKRIRKSEENPQNIQFFLRLKDDYNDEVEQNLPEEIKPYAIKETQVVINMPRTKEQYISFNQYWPVTFKVQSYEIAQFSQTEKDEIFENMRACIVKAKEAYEQGHKFNACAIYDPQKKKLLQFASDATCRKQNSINHCVMNVMKSFGQNYIVTAQQKKHLPKSEEITKDSSVVDKVIEDDKESLEVKKDEIEEIEEVKINSKRKSEESIEESLSSYYYCTGLDLFIVQEPCIMCSMALIHSRVRRVYYSLRNSKQEQFGGLNEDLMINYMETLNHSFLVFQNVETDYANEMLNKLSSQEIKK